MENNFDIHAQNYDVVFTHSVIGKAQRDQVYAYLKKELDTKSQLRVLELNCGTGEDAVYLHKQGHHVIATDISEEMITVAKSKHQDITFQTLDITTITPTTFDQKFDLIFSNFGGLNCLSDVQLKTFLRTSEALLTDQGKLVMVIMPKNTLWERFYFLLKFQFKNAFRRNTTKAIYANVEGVQVPTWYYNPKDVVHFAEAYIQPKTIKPIGIAIPPSYLEPYFKNKPRFMKLLITLESWFQKPFWAKYADHFLISFEKK
ncbi:class I SAM-dependent methyltransferase [uncultured Dokdonia sp.]|uniref:class I SAM-dependent DNA methyltransferase n=1 Tax=uncultured Dokdonia sp. TaxID=575653 RepID=UPI00262EEEA0|nr:class I SAM-dependent methyltransferase [uncultured Dokdonia sp.]